MNALLSLKFLEGRRTIFGVAGLVLLVANAVLHNLGIVPFDLSTNPTVLTALGALGLGGLAGKANRVAATAAELKQLVAELRAADKPQQP